MTEKALQDANEMQELIKKFEAAKANNFQISIDNWTGGSISDSNLRPETQAKLKQLFIDELEYLRKSFDSM